MISCGEPSGDLYAGALATEILRSEPSAVITGFGGDRLRAAGASLVGDFSGLSVTGLMEVVRVLPRTYATYRRLVRDAETTRPDVFVAVDFPDFNFTLARAVRKRGVPVVYYISPQLWAWRRGRMKTMRRIADRVLVIFPFEEAIYRDAGVPVQWVGHPLLDVAGSPSRGLRSCPPGTRSGSPGRRACCPGSRRNELRAILPDLVSAARPHSQPAAAACSGSSRARRIFPTMSSTPVTTARCTALAVVEGRTDDVLASCRRGPGGVGNGDSAGRAARVSDGRRVPAVCH